MGYMKELDIRLRSGGDEAIAAFLEYISRTSTIAGWVSVSERLPEDGQSVIVFWGKYKEVGEAVFEKDKWFSTDRGDCFDVSHWMPLPEPPA